MAKGKHNMTRHDLLSLRYKTNQDIKMKSNQSNFDDKVSFYQKGLNKVRSEDQLNVNRNKTRDNKNKHIDYEIND